MSDDAPNKDIIVDKDAKTISFSDKVTGVALKGNAVVAEVPGDKGKIEKESRLVSDNTVIVPASLKQIEVKEFIGGRVRIGKDADLTLTGNAGWMGLSGEGTFHRTTKDIGKLTIDEGAKLMLDSKDDINVFVAGLKDPKKTDEVTKFAVISFGGNKDDKGNMKIEVGLQHPKTIILSPGAKASFVLDGKEYEVENNKDKTQKEILEDFDKSLKDDGITRFKQGDKRTPLYPLPDKDKKTGGAGLDKSFQVVEADHNTISAPSVMQIGTPSFRS